MMCQKRENAFDMMCQKREPVGKGDKISGALAVPHGGHSVPVHSVP